MYVFEVSSVFPSDGTKFEHMIVVFCAALSLSVTGMKIRHSLASSVS